jgi:hypothetical protein
VDDPPRARDQALAALSGQPLLVGECRLVVDVFEEIVRRPASGAAAAHPVCGLEACTGALAERPAGPVERLTEGCPRGPSPPPGPGLRGHEVGGQRGTLASRRELAQLLTPNLEGPGHCLAGDLEEAGNRPMSLRSTLTPPVPPDTLASGKRPRPCFARCLTLG